MNQYTQALLNQINSKLKDKPLIYFAREVERAIGLEEYLENYHIFCIEDHYIVDQLIKKQKEIYCTTREQKNLPSSSTIDLLRDKGIQEIITKKTNGNFFAQVFQNSGPIENEIKKLNGTQLNSSFLLSKKYENKITQYTFLKDVGVNVPEGKIVNIADESYDSLKKDLGTKFVIQLEKSHTGGGTFIVDSEDTYSSVKNKYNGNIVKVTKFIEGNVYTANGCATSKGVYLSAVQYQITGITELALSSGTTVGNDWSYAKSLDKNVKDKTAETLIKIGEAMFKEGFKGIFGIDFIVSNDAIFVLEINARQTANIPMQTQLELKHDIVPQALISLANWLGIEIPFEPSQEIPEMDGAQVFLRSKKDSFEIAGNIKSGIYRLQGDNSAADWSSENPSGTIEGVIYLDEAKDKPFIWQNDGYGVNQIQDGGVVLLVQAKGTIKNTNEELARIQSSTGLVDNNNVKPWVLETLKAVENMIL